VLLQALGRLGDRRGWTCWIVGGPQRPAEAAYLGELQALARDLGIEARVRFLGQRADVGVLLQAADVYCQPNTAPEGFGLTFIEAMRAGLPVVTSGIGGACEVVDGHCGVLTAPGDVPALAGGLRRLLDDAEFRMELGDEARRRSSLLCHPARQMARLQSVLASVPGEAGDPGLVGARLR
jgi:glycosyltransferase involved in cell wall biosynthesis